MLSTAGLHSDRNDTHHRFFLFPPHPLPSSFTSIIAELLRICKICFHPHTIPAHTAVSWLNIDSIVMEKYLHLAANQLTDITMQCVSVKSEHTFFNSLKTNFLLLKAHHKSQRELHSNPRNFVPAPRESCDICFYPHGNPATRTSIRVGFPWNSRDSRPVHC